MQFLLLGLHILVCFILILVVLLQSGKGADLAGAFGGGGSQTALGSRGAATVLSKATTASAVIFMITSLALALYSSRRTSAVLESAPPVQQAPAPKSATPPSPTGQQTPGPGSTPPAGATEGTEKPAPQQPAPAQPESKKP